MPPSRCPRLLLLSLAVILAAAPAARAGGSDRKKEVFSVRVHGEAGQEEGEKFCVPVVLLDGRKTSVSIMPLLSEHDVRSVQPFHAADGTYGVYLTLTPHGANLLSEYSIENMGRGKELAVMVGGRHVVDLVVDKQVRDGLFPIPSGLTILEAGRFATTFPITGMEKRASERRKKEPFLPSNIMPLPRASDLRGAASP
jgi:hypothetical protein